MKQPTASALPLADARRRIAARIAPVTEVERVRLVDSLDRVLAADLVSTVDIPGHDNAAMDGYALPADRRTTASSFAIVGTALGGRPYTGAVDADQCVRIMTGAVMPAACDAVVPQENVEVIEGQGRIRFDGAIKPGQHRRSAGEDLRIGQVALRRGRRLAPSDLGVAASTGCGTLAVLRRPRVAVFSTGAELRDPDDADESLSFGAIRDANRYTLIGLLKRLDVDVVDLGIVDDDPDTLEAVLRRACGATVRADAIVTSGGVSVGDADYTRDVMSRLGSVDFWTLAVKPGRPMAFGRIASEGRDALMFGLPGNPVAAMVVFYALVRDALLALAGGTPEPVSSIAAICDEDVAKAPGRTEFLRGIARREMDGWHVRTTGSQGSGVLRSMSEANCLIVLDHDRGVVTRGEKVEAWPFRGLL